MHEELFEKISNFVISHGNGECTEWIGNRDKQGYPRIKGRENNKSKTYRVARVLMEYITNQKLPSYIYVCHKCDNPECLNPDHLFLGTALDNTRDMIKKGRHKPRGVNLPKAIKEKYEKEDEKLKEHRQTNPLLRVAS